MNTSKPPGERRITSSNRQPFPGVPLPLRVVAKSLRTDEENILEPIPDKEWQAGVRKVEMCSLAEYDDGKGLRTMFDASWEKGHCHLQCQGGVDGLTIAIKVTEHRMDKSPLTLRSFHLPSGTCLLGIRLYDADVSMEFREELKDPKERKSRRRAAFASGDCWVIKLDVSLCPESVLVHSKTMLRRLESVTRQMPFDWFSYRNYLFSNSSSTEVKTSNLEFGDAFVHKFMGGYIWRFTGVLASTSFREALGYESDVAQVETTADEMAPGQVAVNVAPEAQLPTTARGKKAAKLVPKKLRRSERVRRRRKALQAVSFAPQSRPVDSLPEDGDPDPVSADEWEIEGLMARRTRKKKVQYLVRWSGDFAPSWEPAEHCTSESIAIFEDKGPCSSPPAGEKS